MDPSLAGRPPPAVGTDDAGRRQYLYHEQFRAEEQKAKHEHVRQVARALPELRGKVSDPGHRLRGPPAGPRLLPHRQRPAHPLQRDVGEITLSCPAKGGVETVRALVDEQVRTVARALLRRPREGDRFLAYYARGFWHDLHNDDLSAALLRLSGTDVTAKDLRTWHAAVAVAVAAESGRATRTARRRQITRAVREVSHYLGNTPAVCRSSAIAPAVFDCSRTT
ncbi:hypothetical protein ACWCQS_22025 [Streptomyces sp. NPDC002076]